MTTVTHCLQGCQRLRWPRSKESFTLLLDSCFSCGRVIMLPPLCETCIGCRLHRIDYKLCMLIHKVSVGHAPLYLTNLPTAYADVPSKAALSAYTSGDYVVPRTRLKLDERAFSVAAPLAWNRLPTTLTLVRCTVTFKRQLKTVLYDIAYNA